MVRETVSETMERIKAHRTPVRLEHFFEESNRAGVGSVPMVILLSVFVGLTMALLTGYQLQFFGLVTLVPAVASVSFTREMGPLFTGIVLASRIGAAYTAELGAMTAGGEVAAIEGMGIGALRYLVTPRILAIFFLTPCLTVISVVAGICGAAFISDLMLQISYGFFYDQVIANLLVKDLMAGIVKSFLFGAIIGLIACYKGLSVRGGAAGVGTATTSSVVTAISAVIICDSFCNVFIVLFFP
ncbi:phospholipid/cholesterol/gamma-HCH transport system permease protein [Verrucomicrobium sp. GAS474]|nr:phospholipid/cholesterol/gamma-HCH transport system permease protein [Verrucomicrobium sp. GAS474]